MNAKSVLTALIFGSILSWLIPSPMSEVKAMDDIVRGVTLKLAEQRKATISNVVYDLGLKLESTGPISAKIKIRFNLLANSRHAVVLDFNAPKSSIQQCRFNGEDSPPEITNGHLVWKQFPTNASEEQLNSTRHEIEIDFIAGDPSLNRNEEFLYTLLVPDRASTVFPCFDQPDLKAAFNLELDLPPDWIASANGRLESSQALAEGRTKNVFQKTKPISTYLFAFAAGKFEAITREIDGRRMTMLHRESDQAKLDRNVDIIFKTHAMSLDWLENYTDIEYQFDKFDFVLIPSFQYGGMEHIGNIFYNADQLLLDESGTKNQKLNRARLIAHETAHMWFGNLVTMKWFDDVWLKEVFANFMAAKIVHPSFPEINHDLGFLLNHHPTAYGEDRSAGTYPIQQKLDNLRNAGTLYGRIIYQKAPVVMRQLETMISQATLRDGLREYLKTYQFGNAIWDDLIAILDSRTEIDLKSWSEAWVKEAGTPELDSRVEENESNRRVLNITQTRVTPQDRFWSQQVDIKVISDGKVVFETRAMIEGETTEIELPDSIDDYDFFLANGSELGYGYFRLDKKSETFLRGQIQTIEDDVTRGAAWLALYESLIRGTVGEDQLTPIQFLNALKNGLSVESEPLNRQNLLNQLETVFWRFLSHDEQKKLAVELESQLWNWVESEIETDAKSAYFKTLIQIATTDKTVNRLKQFWQAEQADVDKLPLSENDLMNLAYELAIRLPSQSAKILDEQQERLKNEDRRKRFQFVRRALSPEASNRDDFFETLKLAKNRRPERWALDAIRYLHHPLRASESEKYILPSLELLEEIQTTGDIFFPKRWLATTFSGHRSPSAAKIVRQFLAARPDYPFRLRNKILQSADLMLKAADRQTDLQTSK